MIDVVASLVEMVLAAVDVPATSREPLSARAEYVLQLPPLETPTGDNDVRS